MPRPLLTPRKDPLLIVQEAGWAPGPVWTGGKSHRHRDSIPDCPARSSVTIPTELLGPQQVVFLAAKDMCRASKKENFCNVYKRGGKYLF